VKPASYVADFDSTAGLVRALSRYLRGKDSPALGMMPRTMQTAVKPIVGLGNRLPESLKESIYAVSGWVEAVQPEKLHKLRSEKVAEWFVKQYPHRSYPAVMVGSSNGAAMHIAAALGIPWLPQTFLVPVRRGGVEPDDGTGDLEAAREPARYALDANPDLELHHMHDPNQDRLMIHYMTYFRFKWLRLPEAYRRFISERLEPGGTIITVECELRWPTKQVAERHIFQPGALGGAEPEEFLHGGERVEQYMRRYGLDRKEWEYPEPDGERPEAEWGFAPEMREGIDALANEIGCDRRRMIFENPEDVSPLAADLYRRWYAERQMRSNRLLVESFLMVEPWWTLRTGSVPFWCVFGVEHSADALEQYLDSVDPYDEIYVLLFSHGTGVSAWPASTAGARSCGARASAAASSAWTRTGTRGTSPRSCATTMRSAASPLATRCRTR
jgi:hypothetical protein